MRTFNTEHDHYAVLGLDAGDGLGVRVPACTLGNSGMRGQAASPTSLSKTSGRQE